MKNVFITNIERNFGPLLARAFTEEGATIVTGECDLARVDVVVNNVLFPVEPQAFAAISFDVWKRKIEVELTGSFFLFKSVLPHMTERRWGRIINFTGRATDPLSASTERGMLGLTRGIAREYAKYNITANCIGISAADQETNAIALLAVSLAGENVANITGQCIFTKL